MNDKNLHESDGKLLAGLLDPGGDCRLWLPEELHIILKYQLSSAIQFDLANLDPGGAEQLKTLCAAQSLLIKSFGDLFHHPHPPVELLALTKDFVKACRAHPESPLPAEIAAVLYYASIVVAMTKCRKRISQLDYVPLRCGLEQLVDQPWLDEPTRTLFREGIEFLNSRDKQTP
jgi:hypothetical protein